MYRGERFNSISHLFGLVAAGIGAAVLVTLAWFSGDPRKIVATLVYGSGMVLVYAVSTLYHSTSGRLKVIFRKFDHIAIYIMIAGTYTPFCLITLKGELGILLLSLAWGLALLGVIFELTLAHRSRVPSFVLYFLMGFMSLAALRPMVQGIPGNGFYLLLLGSFFYIAGFFFFLLDEKLRHAHGIWHLCVIGGSASQYLCIFLCLISTAR